MYTFLSESAARYKKNGFGLLQSVPSGGPADESLSFLQLNRFSGTGQLLPEVHADNPSNSRESNRSIITGFLCAETEMHL